MVSGSFPHERIRHIKRKFRHVADVYVLAILALKEFADAAEKCLVVFKACLN
jgi:hypothetical protein